MHQKITLTTMLLALTAIPVAAQAQGVSLATGYTDLTTWSTYGSAATVNFTPGNGFTYSQLQLTAPDTPDSAGAGFAPEAITLDFNEAFSFDFHFYIPSGSVARGDGLTFTLSDTPGVGIGGSGLGYEGLSNNSLAFAIDTFNFAEEPVSPSIQILQNGNITPLASTETGLGDNIKDITWQWYASLVYTPSGLNDEQGQLTGSIYRPDFGNFLVSASIDLSNLGSAVSGGHQVYYGFTASNGLADDGHFVTSAAPVPLPSAVWMFLVGFMGLLLKSRKQ